MKNNKNNKSEILNRISNNNRKSISSKNKKIKNNVMYINIFSRLITINITKN